MGATFMEALMAPDIVAAVARAAASGAALAEALKIEAAEKAAAASGAALAEALEIEAAEEDAAASGAALAVALETEAADARASALGAATAEARKFDVLYKYLHWPTVVLPVSSSTSAVEFQELAAAATGVPSRFVRITTPSGRQLPPDSKATLGGLGVDEHASMAGTLRLVGGVVDPDQPPAGLSKLMIARNRAMFVQYGLVLEVLPNQRDEPAAYTEIYRRNVTRRLWEGQAVNTTAASMAAKREREQAELAVSCRSPPYPSSPRCVSPLTQLPPRRACSLALLPARPPKPCAGRHARLGGP
jgi:hypothetical protein